MAELKRLPLLKYTPVNEREDLFIRKLQQCCVIFNFSTNPLDNLDSKVVKELTLNELMNYIFQRRRVITEAIYPEIMLMFSCNAFYTLLSTKLVPEPDPHLRLVYKFFFVFLESPDTRTRHVRRYIDEKFVHMLLQLFDSKGERERELLKKILHKMYGKFVGLREYIRNEINNIFYWFIYESERHNGIVQLLEVVASIIKGLAVPLRDEHKKTLLPVIMSLHKPESFHAYLPQLVLCIQKFLIKDSTLAVIVVRSLLKFWPKVDTWKETLFLKELEEIIMVIEKDEFPNVMGPVFRHLAKCVMSPHHDVAKCALKFWNNKHFMSLAYDHSTVFVPIMFPSLYERFHFKNKINRLIGKAKKMCRKMNPRLYDQYVEDYVLYKYIEETQTKEREEAWSKIETLASKNRATVVFNANKIEKLNEDVEQMFDWRKQIRTGT